MQKPRPSPPSRSSARFFSRAGAESGWVRWKRLDAHARWSQGRRRDAHARQRRDTTTVMVRPPAIARSAPVLIAVVVGHQQRAWRRQERSAHTRLVAAAAAVRPTTTPACRALLGAGTRSTRTRACGTSAGLLGLSQPRTGRLLLRRAQGAGLCRPAAPARAGRRTGAGGERARAALPAAPPRGRLRGAALPPLRRRPAPSARCCPCTLASKRSQVPEESCLVSWKLCWASRRSRFKQEYDLTEKELRVLIAAGALLYATRGLR